jgi:hypothetical protein
MTATVMSALSRTAYGLIALGMASPAPALACPSCASATGDQVRGIIAGETLVSGLLAVSLPLLAFAIVASALPRLLDHLLTSGRR